MGRTFATPSGKVGPVCCGMGNSRKINYNLVEENDKFMIREERKCCDKGERPHSVGGWRDVGGEAEPCRERQEAVCSGERSKFKTMK